MSRDETARELEKLRADVAALSDARGEAASKPAEPPPQVEDPATVVETVAVDADIPESAKTQMEELGDLLQAEIRDLPTITCLTVFSLGILMGRLLR